MKNCTLLKMLCLIGVGLVGCTRATPDQSQIRIQMPAHAEHKSTPARKVTELDLTSIRWGLNDPGSLDELGCYAVFVGGSEAVLSGNSCKDTANVREFRFGMMVGLFADGQVATISGIPSGPARRIVVIGGSVRSGESCESAFANGGNVTVSRYSAPFVVGDITRDLSPGTVDVSITELLTDFKVGQCNFLQSGTSGVKAALLTNGDVVGSAFAALSISNPTNDSLVQSDSSGSGAVVADTSGQISMSGGLNAPPMVYSITRKPDTGQYFGLLHDGKVVAVDASGSVNLTPVCPFRTCQVPVWFQSISAGMGGDLFGLDHGGNIYRMRADGTPEKLMMTVSPNVKQVAFY